jgi:hypothetical protein
MSLTSFPNGIANHASQTAMVAGTGVTTGTGTVVSHGVVRIGDIVKTTIYVDATGLDSNVLADIIGVAGGTANCHIGQITTARNGTIVAGTVKCLETPLTGEPDIDLYSADEGTLAEDTAITAGTNDTALLAAAADWTVALVAKPLTGFPAADQYLYLVGGGGTTDATYTAGKFLIELYGTV